MKRVSDRPVRRAGKISRDDSKGRKIRVRESSVSTEKYATTMSVVSIIIGVLVAVVVVFFAFKGVTAFIG